MGKKLIFECTGLVRCEETGWALQRLLDGFLEFYTATKGEKKGLKHPTLEVSNQQPMPPRSKDAPPLPTWNDWLGTGNYYTREDVDLIQGFKTPVKECHKMRECRNAVAHFLSKLAEVRDHFEKESQTLSSPSLSGSPAQFDPVRQGVWSRLSVSISLLIMNNDVCRFMNRRTILNRSSGASLSSGTVRGLYDVKRRRGPWKSY